MYADSSPRTAPNSRYGMKMTHDVWTQAVDDARWAPSTHNTQPWTFRRTSEGLELLADRTRSLPDVERVFRGLVLNGGAALHHLRVALRGRGHDVATQPFPDDGDEPVLARVRLRGMTRQSPLDADMLRAIRERHNRPWALPRGAASRGIVR